MKKSKIIIVALLTSFGVCSCNNKTNTSSHGPLTYSYSSISEDSIKVSSEKLFPIYLSNDASEIKAKITFFNAYEKLPYISFLEGMNLYKWLHINYYLDPNFDYTLTLNQDSTYVIKRENNATLTINTIDDTLTFSDKDNFTITAHSEASSLLPDYGEIQDLKSQNVFAVAKDKANISIEKGNKTQLIPLSNYNIDLISFNGNAYIPFQTFSDLFFSEMYFPLACLKNRIIDVSNVTMKNNDSYSDDALLLSFNYYETCLYFDYYYGLKDEKNVQSFDKVFKELDYKDRFLTSIDEANKALNDFIHYFFDDGHSSFKKASRNSVDAMPKDYGERVAKMIENSQTLSALRKEKIQNLTAYQEINDTAFITFDKFNAIPDGIYDSPLSEQIEKDNNSSLVLPYVCNYLSQNDSIKNVVVDVTLNGGGDIRCGVFIAGMLLGEKITTYTKSYATGNINKTDYYSDADLNHVIDSNDAPLKNKNVYLLTSNYTFSAANMLSSAFYMSGNGKIIGQQSGGGACAVLPSSTMFGTQYQISGSMMILYKNNDGVISNVDKGLPVDIEIQRENLYDREDIAALLNERK